jgi:drug/metabolite transporter (DMT)-like permease
LILLAVAPILWSIGSVWGSHLDLPRPAMATATQLLAGGAVLALLGALRGERITELPSAPAWLALGYLIVFGSIVAYTAYVYLLRTVRPALATSYAYANPVVAVALGVTLGAEVLTGPAFIALPLILAGVGLAALAPRRARREREPLSFSRSRRVGEQVRDLSTDTPPTTGSPEPEECCADAA